MPHVPTSGRVVAIQPLRDGRFYVLRVRTSSGTERQPIFTRRTFDAMVRHRGSADRILTQLVELNRRGHLVFAADRSSWSQVAERGEMLPSA